MHINPKKVAVTFAAGAFALLGAGTGVALADDVDGGIWNHGNSGGRVWSNFWHPTDNHGSSVQGHEYVDSGCQGADTWARAQTHSKWLPWGIDGSYYRFC